MKKWILACAAAALIGGDTAPAGAQGLISALKDKVTGGSQPEPTPAVQAQAQATPPPAEGAKGGNRRGNAARPNVQVVEGTPPPQTGTPQPTPDKETIRRGAQKLLTQMNTEKIPGDLFRKYAGKWKGDFWVYSPQGKLEESKSVSLEFTATSNGMKMESFSFDRISRTWVTAETATYTKDGDTVQVSIQRPNGQVSRQVGRYNDGQLFLVSEIRDGMEHLRERVDGKRLLIDGFGAYTNKQGGEYHVFIGRFLKEGR